MAASASQGWMTIASTTSTTGTSTFSGFVAAPTIAGRSCSSRLRGERVDTPYTLEERGDGDVDLADLGRVAVVLLAAGRLGDLLQHRRRRARAVGDRED